MSILDDVRTFILTLGPPWSASPNNVFTAEWSDQPDTACVIYEYPGELSHVIGGVSAPLETARFQVVCRALQYSVARDNADALLTALDAVSAVGWVDRILAEDTPHPLPVDGHDRRLIAVNYSAMKERP